MPSAIQPEPPVSEPAPNLTPVVLLIAGVAFIARFIYLLEFRSSVFFTEPILDAAFHRDLAAQIASGHPLAGAPYFRAPFYTWFLAFINAIAGSSPWAPRLVQALFGALAAGGIAWAAGSLADRRAAIAAGLVMAFYGPLVYSSGELLHEALAVPLVVLALVFFIRGQKELCDEDAGASPWFLGALALGVAVITRPSVLGLLPAALAAPFVLTRDPAVRRRARRLVLPILAGALLPVLPVTAVNFISSGDLVWIASQGGINFYAGNNPEADGRHVIIPELDNAAGWEDFVPRVEAIAETDVGRRLRDSEVSDYWFNRGLSWIRNNPGAAVRLYAVKIGTLLSGYEVPNNRDIGIARRDSLLLAILVGRWGPLFVPWGLLLPLAVLGLTASPFRRRLFLVWSAPVLYALMLLPFFICDRFRLPMVPFLAVPAGIGLTVLFRLPRTFRDQRGPALAAVGMLVLANLTWGVDTKPNPADAWHKLGEALYNRGDYEPALEAFDHAAALAPEDDLSRLGRAWTLEAVGRDSLAGAEFEILAARLPDVWLAQYGYGKWLLRTNRAVLAVPHLERAAGLVPDRSEVHRDLGFAYEAAGNDAAAGLALAHALKLGEDTAELHLSLGLVALRRGSPEIAENNWLRGLELEPRHFRTLYNLGLLAFTQRQFEEAGDIWRRAGAADPRNPLPPFQLARLAARSGDTAAASRLLATAIALGLPADEARKDPLLADVMPEEP